MAQRGIPIPPRGGSDPAHTEVVFAGPYRGFDSDESQWYLGENGIFDDVSNIDFLKGQAQTRPGVTTVYSDINALTASYSSEYANTGDLAYNLVAENGKFNTDSLLYGINAYSPWWYYGCNVAYPPESLAAAGGKTQFQYTASTSSTTSGLTTVTGAATLWTRERVVGGYFKLNSDNDAAWTQIASVTSDTSLELTQGYLGSTSVGSVAYTIAIPMVINSTQTLRPITDFSWSRSSGFAVGGTSGSVLTGSYGSMFAQTNATPERLQLYTKFPWYQANCAAYYGNRLFLGTDSSVSTTVNNTSTTSHAGRVAYSANGDIRDFAAASSGAFDLETNSVRWLIVMRDVLYAFSADSIFSIQKTGNSYLPFRAQKLYEGLRFAVHYKPCLVDNSYIVVTAFDGIYKFDGSSLSPLSDGTSEFFKGIVYSDNSANVCSGASFYDPFRQRIGLCSFGPSTSRLYMYDMRAGGWTVWSPPASTKFVAVVPAMTTTSTGQDVELTALLGSTLDTSGLKYVKFSRSVASDDSVNITWNATTPVLDAATSRDRKSCDRVRVVYECSGTAESISASLYTDGGTTAEWTKTITLEAGTAGQLKNAYLTFAPVTGQMFSLKLSGATDTKVKICQIALSFVNRQEARPS